MGEETDIAEPMTSDTVVEAEDGTAYEPSKDQNRQRKKHLYKSIRELMEFYMGDVNLSKNRHMFDLIQGQTYVYVDLSEFMTFNKLKALTSNIKDVAKAIKQSDILQLSDDEKRVCRKTPLKKKENEEECTIYVEQFGPDVDHDLLTKVFSEFGPVDYVSMPKFSHNNKFKGFAFVEFKNREGAQKAIESFSAKGCCLSPQMVPVDLMSIKSFEGSKKRKHKFSENENNACHAEGNARHLKNKVSTRLKVQGDEEASSCKKAEESSENEDIQVEKEKDNDCGHIDKTAEKKKSKRKHCADEEASISKKMKSVESKSNDTKQEKSEIPIKDPELKKQKNIDDASEEKKNKAKDRRTTVGKDTSDKTSPTVDKGNFKDKLTNKNKTTEKGGKRKQFDEEAESASDSEKQAKELDEPSKKKLKSDTEAETDDTDGVCCDDQEDEEKQKKKRKKRKKVKKDKSSVFSLGLKVLPKKEWKLLRNKYLQMQRDQMNLLKQHLTMNNHPFNDTVSSLAKPFVPGTVVKVTLDKSVSNATSARSELRLGKPEIRYVDVTEGSPVVHLRLETHEAATSLVQSAHWPCCEVITGEEEKEYHEKIEKDRELHFIKKQQQKPNERGRTRLLKRAERYQGKHITFESSQN